MRVGLVSSGRSGLTGSTVVGGLDLGGRQIAELAVEPAALNHDTRRHDANRSTNHPPRPSCTNRFGGAPILWLHCRMSLCATTEPGRHLEAVLVLPDPTDGLWDAVNSGWAETEFPELPALSMEQDPIHRHKDVLSHTITVVANTSPRLRLRLAALFHDIAKPKTRRLTGTKVTFHHHEAAGSRMTTTRLTALGFADDLVADVARLVELSGRFHGYAHGWTDSAVRRYARDAGPLLGDLNELVRCDCTTRHPHKVRGLQRQVDDLERRIRELAAADEERRHRPPLDGTEIMELLDLPPGPAIGRALRMLRTLEQDDPDIGHDDAVEALRGWWAAERVAE